MNEATQHFFEDCKEKKVTARSAFSTRGHTGKRGAVKFASDFMTQREINAMNGPCISYRLGEPRCWETFRAMPDDLKVSYITKLRAKFGVTDTALAEMFDISKSSVSKVFKELKLKHRSTEPTFDKDAWAVWLNGTV